MERYFNKAICPYCKALFPFFIKTGQWDWKRFLSPRVSCPNCKKSLIVKTSWRRALLFLPASLVASIVLIHNLRRLEVFPSNMILQTITEGAIAGVIICMGVRYCLQVKKQS